MNLNRCYKILEIAPGASMEEIKQAYRDAVVVWHPDRFSNNSRLKHKAEQKLREINQAYEMLEMHFSQNARKNEKEKSAQEMNTWQAVSKVEAVAELSTRLVLHACHFLYNAIKNKKEK